MYGQAKGRQTGEIKLVKLCQLDRLDSGRGLRSGHRRYGRRYGSRYGRTYARAYVRPARNRKNTFQRFVPAMLLVFLLVAAGFFGGVRFVLADDTPEVKVVEMEKLLSGGAETENLGESTSEGKIMLLEEQGPKIPLVVIDPGHGGEDDGCTREGVSEMEINLQLAQLLAQKLQALGIDAILTREDSDTYLSLEDRVQIAEEQDADVFISIHQNSFEEKDNSVEGIETWYDGTNPNSRRLAQLVNMGAVDKTGAQERGLMDSRDLYVIRETSMSSCLIETSFLSNQKEREAISDPAYQDKVTEGIAWGIQYYFYPKTMYLTFDDGPSEENTAAVLDILKEHDIKATFFVVGENVRKHPDIARRIVEEGHTIGIHCNRHDYDEIYESVNSYLADFKEAYDAVYEVTGVEIQLFRFPGGSINAYSKDVYKEIIEKMTEEGFTYFDWNGSLEDAAKNTTPGQLIQNARESTLGRKKVVMLAHDIVYNTTLCLEELIEQFPEYRMEPLTPDVMPIQFAAD